MSDFITVLYSCAHRSQLHRRRNLGAIDPSPVRCECLGCWPGEIKDLSRFVVDNPKIYWCPDCQRGWQQAHGATVEVVQTHKCGHQFVRTMNSLHFLPANDGKYYSSHPFDCPDCCDLSKEKWAIWDDGLQARGTKYNESTQGIEA